MNWVVTSSKGKEKKRFLRFLMGLVSELRRKIENDATLRNRGRGNVWTFTNFYVDFYGLFFRLHNIFRWEGNLEYHRNGSDRVIWSTSVQNNLEKPFKSNFNHNPHAMFSLVKPVDRLLWIDYESWHVRKIWIKSYSSCVLNWLFHNFVCCFASWLFLKLY